MLGPHHTAALTSAGQQLPSNSTRIRQVGQQYCPNAPCQILSAETRVSLTLIWSPLAISGRGEAGAGTNGRGRRPYLVSSRAVREFCHLARHLGHHLAHPDGAFERIGT